MRFAVNTFAYKTLTLYGSVATSKPIHCVLFVQIPCYQETFHKEEGKHRTLIQKAASTWNGRNLTWLLKSRQSMAAFCLQRCCKTHEKRSHRKLLSFLLTYETSMERKSSGIFFPRVGNSLDCFVGGVAVSCNHCSCNITPNNATTCSHKSQLELLPHKTIKTKFFRTYSWFWKQNFKKQMQEINILLNAAILPYASSMAYKETKNKKKN